MGGGDFEHWTNVFDGKVVKKCNTFSQLFLSMDPHCSAFFFFFVSSPLSHLSSLLYTLPHVSELTQLSPQKWKNSPTSHNSHPTSNQAQPTVKLDLISSISSLLSSLCWVGDELSSISGWIFEHRPTTVKLSRAVDALRRRWRFWSAGVWSYGEGIEGIKPQMKSNEGI